MDPNISYHSPLKPFIVGSFHTNVGLLLNVVPFRGPLSATTFQKSFIEGWRDLAGVWNGASGEGSKRGRETGERPDDARQVGQSKSET